MNGWDYDDSCVSFLFFNLFYGWINLHEYVVVFLIVFIQGGQRDGSVVESV